MSTTLPRFGIGYRVTVRAPQIKLDDTNVADRKLFLKGDLIRCTVDNSDRELLQDVWAYTFRHEQAEGLGWVAEQDVYPYIEPSADCNNISDLMDKIRRKNNEATL